MQIEVKNLFTTQFDKPGLPDNPKNCCVLVTMDIGECGSPAASIFHFQVVTPAFLAHRAEVRWGRGTLFVPEFSWAEVDRMVSRVIASVNANTWEEAANQLCKYFEWEYDGYTS